MTQRTGNIYLQLGKKMDKRRGKRKRWKRLEERAMASQDKLRGKNQLGETLAFRNERRAFTLFRIMHISILPD